MSAEQKGSLINLARCWNVSLPATAVFHAYFMLYAWNAEWSLKEVLLVPTNWIDASDGDALRERSLSRGLREIAVVHIGDGKPAFDNALTPACLVTTQPRYAKSFLIHPIGNGSGNAHSRFAQTPARK